MNAERHSHETKHNVEESPPNMHISKPLHAGNDAENSYKSKVDSIHSIGQQIPKEEFENVSFILHPSLNYSNSTTNNAVASTNNQGNPRPLKLATQKSSRRILSEKRERRRVNQRLLKPGQLPLADDPCEYFVTETADEILYQIVSGNWNYKNLIFDEENDKGTRKVGLKPCSNAHCVREAENQRRRKQMLSKNYLPDPYQEEHDVIFEDGNLPSYHSLLNLWNEKKYNWSPAIFSNGVPKNDLDFLTAWRECRKNPAAYGLNVSSPRELSTPVLICTTNETAKQKSKSNDTDLVVKRISKRRGKLTSLLASRELYNPNWKPVTNPYDREKLKSRYEELRNMYQHLPVLKKADYINNPSTVKVRLKQAEDWHRLVTITNRPQPMLGLDVRQISDGTNEKDQNENGEDQTTKIPRYAAATASSSKKITQRYF